MTQEEISSKIYNMLCVAYCDNCRFDTEMPGHGACDECRDGIGWAISRELCDRIADEIHN